MSTRDRKGESDKVVELFKRAAEKSGSGKADVPTVSSNISGDGNIVAGRDVNINKRVVTRPKIQPGPQHISASQAAELQKLVKKAAEIDVTGGMSPQAAFQKWWGMVKDKYDVPTYREIPRKNGEEAISWLRQRIAMNRPKLRRTDNKNWRNEHYSAIWARARELGYSKGDVYVHCL